MGKNPNRHLQHWLIGFSLNGILILVWSQASLALAESSPLVIRQPAGEFHWQGFLDVPSEGTYHLGFRFRGQLKVAVGGDAVINQHADAETWTSTPPLDLPSGRTPIELRLQTNLGRLVLGTFWQGPGFRFEPLPGERLTPDGPRAPSAGYNRQRALALLREARCQACHEMPGLGSTALAAPSLRFAGRDLHPDWFTSYLSVSQEPKLTQWARFHGQFAAEDAAAIVGYLKSLPGTREVPSGRDSSGDATEGRHLFFSQGCLACHLHGEQGTANAWSGGDLTQLANKRSRRFVEQWLADPQLLNAHRRMPTFDLSEPERRHLAAFLVPTEHDVAHQDEARTDSSAIARGRSLLNTHRCRSCHEIPGISRPARSKLTKDVPWSASCATRTEPGSQPAYGFAAEDAAMLRTWVHQASSPTPHETARQQIDEHGCLGCHPRGDQPGLTPVATAAAAASPELVPWLPTLLPPSLNSVGDKLHTSFLRQILTRKAPARRPWLRVQMPKFPLSEGTQNSIVQYFVDQDRVPEDAVVNDVSSVASLDEPAHHRLVTSDGFGCTSCHKIGKVQPPPQTAINQLGPDLSQLGSRVRRVWFDRWVRNPARIIPKMEMPSVQVAVPGVLEGDLNQQLEVVWQLLNERRFNPPDPQPTRIVSHSGLTDEPARVLTDVLRFGEQTLIKPFLVGLSNRHSVLFDLQRGRLAGWWTGDVARQRTQGKTWYWEAPFFDLRVNASQEAEFRLHWQGKSYLPQATGQFVMELDGWETVAQGIRLKHRLHFDVPQFPSLNVVQEVRALPQGWTRKITCTPLPPGAALEIRSSGLESSPQPEYRIHVAGAVELTYPNQQSPLAAIPPSPPLVTASKQLPVMPGFEATQLPLRSDVMPTALAWSPSGKLFLASLKGRVWGARDTNQDELEDELTAWSDDLPAPYGVHATEEYVDVVTKFGVVRLRDRQGNGRADSHELVASGWGHTDDYHDWAVGLPMDPMGNYYVAIPCQQDERSPAAAKFRGRVLRLRPRAPSATNPRRYAIEEWSAGHRFPMGIARNQAGHLFVTDNQGNYNPFNELNHVVAGAHFGFINRLEQSLPVPPLTPPAIDIPHPWTRSVNGICFLEPPPGVDDDHFGPFTGHLLGCEYDTRRLVRLSLQQVDGHWQGAAYPLAVVEDPQASLQGPINCGVAPDGDIYIANIRDSGWGGANNTGSVVRIVPRLDALPPGIAEVQALHSGFHLRFTQPIPAQRAGDRGAYGVESYRRVSTPAYGGEDVDRRQENLTQVRADADGRGVTLTLPELREGFVYTFRVEALVPGEPFFPAEAHYTLRRRPAPSVP